MVGVALSTNTANATTGSLYIKARCTNATYTCEPGGMMTLEADYELDSGEYTTGDSWMCARVRDGMSTWVKVRNGWQVYNDCTAATSYEWGYLPKSWNSTATSTSWARVVFAPREDEYFEFAEGWYDVKTGKIIMTGGPTAEERLKKILASRHAPAIITSKTRQAMRSAADMREERARETLRRVLGNQKFRNFLKTGFVSVKAKSGRIYQIFPGHGITAVYERGVMVERLCVVLTGNFPPTDSLIMRYIMVLNNEEQFRGLAVKHMVSTRGTSFSIQPDLRPLPEIYAELKGTRKTG